MDILTAKNHHIGITKNSCDQKVILATALCVLASEALPVFQEEYGGYDGHQHEHHAPPPATSYATISTTHVKVQHPPASYPKYASSPYKVSEIIQLLLYLVYEKKKNIYI